jgi:hypothetical protein
MDMTKKKIPLPTGWILGPHNLGAFIQRHPHFL